MYKDLQVRAAAMSEKERAVAQKRVALTDLRQQVQLLSEQVHRKQQQVNAEALKFQQKKQLQDAKWGERHRHEAGELERLEAIKQDEQAMSAGIAQMERDTADMLRQLQQAKLDAALVDETKSRISELSATLEREDCRVGEFERAVVRMEADLSRRQQKQFDQLPPQFSLPSAAGAPPPALDIGGESIMLVDDNGTC